MTSDANMALVRQWVEQVWNRAELDRIADFHTPVFENEGRPATPDEVKQWHVNNRLTFPDIHYVIEDMFASEDRVALRWRASATHEGSMWNMIPPTGKKISWTGMHLLRLLNARIVEVWALQNNSAQLQQMGVTLLPAQE